jgi:hypothetical protein
MQAGFEWKGWIDEVRISKGIARYQGNNFTPPTLEYTKTIATQAFIM